MKNQVQEINEPEFETEVEMTGGNRIFLAAKIKVQSEAERLHRMHMLFSAPAVHFRLPQGGTAILNLKNLLRLTFYPGPDVTPIDAWPAHHVSRRQESGRIAGINHRNNPMRGANKDCFHN